MSGDRKATTATLLRAVRLADRPDLADRMTVLWDDEACYVISEESIGITLAYSAGGPRKWDKQVWIPTDVLPAVIEAAQRILAQRKADGL